MSPFQIRKAYAVMRQIAAFNPDVTIVVVVLKANALGWCDRLITLDRGWIGARHLGAPAAAHADDAGQLPDR